MNKSFKNSLNSKMFRITSVIAIASILLLVGVVVAQNLRNQAGPNSAKKTRSLSKSKSHRTIPSQFIRTTMRL